MNIDFTDIEKNLPNGQNMGGIPQVVYYAKHTDVLSFPIFPGSDQRTLEKMGQLIGDLEMKSGKKLHRLYITDDEGKLDFEGVGEKDGKSFVMKLRIYQPGLQSKLLGFINLAKNENLIFIVPDNNGNYFLLGDVLRAATLDSIDGMTTGQKTEERPGAGLIFAYKTPNIYRYAGKIPIEQSVVPDPDPEPETAIACCPDGVDDYLSVDINTLSKLGLYPGEGEKSVYTLDVIPGGMTFSVKTTNFVFAFLHGGSGIIASLYIGSKTYMVYNAQTSIDCSDRRVTMRIELSVTSNIPALKLYIDDVEEPLNFSEVEESIPQIEGDEMLILTDGTTFFNGKLFSFSIDKESREGVLTNYALWNFTGSTDAERLKNKAGSAGWFNLTAHNVADMNEFIKAVPVN